MRSHSLVIALFAFVFSWSAHAEYRVFELEITDTTNGQARVIISILDPLQYPRFYPVKPTETIVYRATWMCKGNTANSPQACPNPKT